MSWIDERRCCVCNKQLPYGKAVCCARLKALYCDEDACRAVVNAAEMDYATSPRGRRRTRQAWLAKIRELAKPATNLQFEIDPNAGPMELLRTMNEATPELLLKLDSPSKG